MVLSLTTDAKWVPNFDRWGLLLGIVLLSTHVSWSSCVAWTIAQVLGTPLGLTETLGVFLGLPEGSGAKETCSLIGAFKCNK